MPKKAEAYFEELLCGLGSSPKLLWCFFATLPDPIEDRYEKYVDLFTPRLPIGLNVQHDCAQIETIEEQIINADAIYFHGGRVDPLVEIFGKYDLTQLCKGKTVGTNSASTLMLAEHGWTCDERKCIDGLGIWPAKVLVHFDSDYGSEDPRGPIDWEKAKLDLTTYGDKDLPVYALKEGEFVVFKK